MKDLIFKDIRVGYIPDTKVEIDEEHHELD